MLPQDKEVKGTNYCLYSPGKMDCLVETFIQSLYILLVFFFLPYHLTCLQNNRYSGYLYCYKSNHLLRVFCQLLILCHISWNINGLTSQVHLSNRHSRIFPLTNNQNNLNVIHICPKMQFTKSNRTGNYWQHCRWLLQSNNLILIQGKW